MLQPGLVKNPEARAYRQSLMNFSLLRVHESTSTVAGVIMALFDELSRLSTQHGRGWVSTPVRGGIRCGHRRVLRGTDGPRGRTMILREVLDESLIFFTDARSPKVVALRTNPRCAAWVYGKRKFQVQSSGVSSQS